MAVDQHLSFDFAEYPSIVVPFDATSRIPVHSHPQHQLTWVPHGVLTMDAGSGRWVVQRTRALWIPGGTAHAVVPGCSCEMISLFFEPTECPLSLDSPTVIDATGLVGPLLTYLVSLPETARSQRHHGHTLLWDLVSPMSVATIPSILPTDPQARQVALAIRRDPADTRTLTDWGREVAASSRTLSRRFREETGVSFESWRTFERLSAALPFLGAGMPISKVAHSVGYRTASAFIAAFRREIGTTPAAYFAERDTDSSAQAS
ncbi:helix-turn-helix domain-containing protein [Nocardia alba]|uniref:HTH-type transcriptional regulator RipA n=1 Tax=Nocardia alba TaxID=225051 RepID=A0A4R1FT54_9NOCA|nr:helix-turn-helix transcriptional regulator [Nocardia alba]TCJ95678.1 AraC family transcriptional regulator [Nocardia alba]